MGFRNFENLNYKKKTDSLQGFGFLGKCIIVNILTDFICHSPASVNNDRLEDRFDLHFSFQRFFPESFDSVLTGDDFLVFGTRSVASSAYNAVTAATSPCFIPSTNTRFASSIRCRSTTSSNPSFPQSPQPAINPIKLTPNTIIANIRQQFISSSSLLHNSQSNILPHQKN